MEYKLVTAATSLPVSVAEVKIHLRETSNELDALIEDYIESAVQQFESRTNTAIMPQTWQVSLKEDEVIERVEIYKTPVLGVTSVTYYDSDNAVQSLTNSQGDYLSFVDGRPWSLIFDDTPTVYDRDDAMTITFFAGYSAATSVPADIKLAIKMLVWRMYHHPDDPVSERLSYVDKIVRDYRGWR